jgi:hypothetical protein
VHLQQQLCDGNLQSKGQGGRGGMGGGKMVGVCGGGAGTSWAWRSAGGIKWGVRGRRGVGGRGGGGSEGGGTPEEGDRALQTPVDSAPVWWTKFSLAVVVD